MECCAETFDLHSYYNLRNVSPDPTGKLNNARNFNSWRPVSHSAQGGPRHSPDSFVDWDDVLSSNFWAPAHSFPGRIGEKSFRTFDPRNFLFPHKRTRPLRMDPHLFQPSPDRPPDPSGHSRQSSGRRASKGESVPVILEAEEREIQLSSTERRLSTETSVKRGIPHETDYAYAYDSSVSPALVIKTEGEHHRKHKDHGENIYEEIPDRKSAPRGDYSDYRQCKLKSGSLGANFIRRKSDDSKSRSLFRRSLIEEVMDEVKKVHRRHDKVIGQLNLDIETMIMPSNRFEDLHYPVGPTDELLSPDSGFHSGSGVSTFSQCSPLYENSDPNLSKAGSPASSLKGCLKSEYPPKGKIIKCESLDFREALSFKKCISDKDGKFLRSTSDKKGAKNRRSWKFSNLVNSIRDKKSAPESPQNDVNKGSHDYALYDDSIRRHTNKSKDSRRSWDETLIYEDIDDSKEEIWLKSKRLDAHRRMSSDDSWGSASDRSSDSDHKSDGNESFTARILNAKSKKQKWKEKKRRKNSEEVPNGETNNNHARNGRLSSGPAGPPEGRFTRWFSRRRESQEGDRLDGSPGATEPVIPLPRWSILKGKNVTSKDDSGTISSTFQRRHQPPSLPPTPSDISPEQLKRRHIIASIVHSENSYVSSLQRLVKDYKKELEDSSPPIINHSKISTLFHCLPEILQCHNLFRIALAECVRNWDTEEKIGDVFVSSFSKVVVLDKYSEFINNFNVAMELAKLESKRKSSFADFLKMKQITAHDRLSFFGLMVKPVQRFPQFILQLQDLLKHTPQGHHDRMSLQLALTQLESLAEMLNERKREAEQYQAFKDTLKTINSKFSLRSLADSNRYLLKEGDVTQLEFNQAGLISKSKSRRLFLLNDLLVCVAVSSKAGPDLNSIQERLTYKWSVPVADIEIQDSSTSPTLNRVLTSGQNRSSSLKSDSSDNNSGVEDLCQEMNMLMHDFEIVSRISSLIAGLKGSYGGLSMDLTNSICASIQQSIQQKDAEIAWVDSCCLQLLLKQRGCKEELLTFQTDDPVAKKDWIIELRLAQLALDVNNSPAWDVAEQDKRPTNRMPLFVKALPVYTSKLLTEVRCGCYYTVKYLKPTRNFQENNYLWLASTDGVSTHVSVYLVLHTGLRDLFTFDIVDTIVTALEHVPGNNEEEDGKKMDLIWMGTASGKILVFNASEPEKQEQCASINDLPVSVMTLKYLSNQVFVGLEGGTVAIYRRDWEGDWAIKDCQFVNLGKDPVTSLLPINTVTYASCDKIVFVLDTLSGDILRSFTLRQEHEAPINLMAHSGTGLWISTLKNSTISLYHTETFKHLQDINMASNVTRVLGAEYNQMDIYVTALHASKGLLWVGTNVGVILTIPLPRLEGVPMISGRANVSFHHHVGPINFLLPLTMPRRVLFSDMVPPDPPRQREVDVIHEEAGTDHKTPGKMKKQTSENCLTATKKTVRLRTNFSSPVMSRHANGHALTSTPFSHSRRVSQTLPRGLGLLSVNPSQECDVFGLYGDLMNVRNYDEEANYEPYENLRRSDPDLSALPQKLSTLDRRLRLSVSRPRSLDMSNWSVDSKNSAYTSSGSDDSGSIQGISGAISRSNTIKSTISKASKAGDNIPRTLMTVIGGRGYKCRKVNQEKKSSSGVTTVKVNARDAYIMLWEVKL